MTVRYWVRAGGGGGVWCPNTSYRTRALGMCYKAQWQAQVGRCCQKTKQQSAEALFTYSQLLDVSTSD